MLTAYYALAAVIVHSIYAAVPSTCLIGTAGGTEGFAFYTYDLASGGLTLAKKLPIIVNDIALAQAQYSILNTEQMVVITSTEDSGKIGESILINTTDYSCTNIPSYSIVYPSSDKYWVEEFFPSVTHDGALFGINQHQEYVEYLATYSQPEWKATNTFADVTYQDGQGEWMREALGNVTGGKTASTWVGINNAPGPCFLNVTSLYPKVKAHIQCFGSKPFTTSTMNGFALPFNPGYYPPMVQFVDPVAGTVSSLTLTDVRSSPNTRLSLQTLTNIFTGTVEVTDVNPPKGVTWEADSDFFVNGYCDGTYWYSLFNTDGEAKWTLYVLAVDGSYFEAYGPFVFPNGQSAVSLQCQ